MIIFLLGFLLGAFIGTTFMAILFMGKMEDKMWNQLYKNVKDEDCDQEKPYFNKRLKNESYSELSEVRHRNSNHLN